MTSAWPFIDADNELVADLIAGTVEIVFEQGGWLSPQARIVAREGQLSLTSTADDGTLLMHVPREAFVRISRVSWSDSTEQLEVVDVSDELTVAQSELLILQTALHNACGKLPWLTTHHPSVARDLPDDVVAAVRTQRPRFRTTPVATANVFWSNRVFRLPIGADGQSEAVAVPIADVLNHHAVGATGTWTGDAFDITVQRPVGSTECMLDYGFQRDAIGMAVVYGFADLASPIAHSAPIALDVPGVGPVRVAAVGRARSGALLAPVVTEESDGIVVSQLSFGQGAPSSAGVDPLIVSAVAARNVELLEELIACAGAYPEVPSAGILEAAATRQRQVILDHQP